LTFRQCVISINLGVYQGRLGLISDENLRKKYFPKILAIINFGMEVSDLDKKKR